MSARLPVNHLIQLQIPLHRFERRQLRRAMGEQIVFDAAHAFRGRENFLPRDVPFAEQRRVAVGIRRTVGEQEAFGRLLAE